MECGATYKIEEYINELDARAWERLSNRTCDRV